MKITIPNKEETENKEFSTLPEDDYILEVEEVKEERQPKYQQDGEEDVLNIRFNVLGLRDGGKLVDDNDEPAENRKLFFTARLESMGFQQDGTPSKTRQLLCYVTKTDINDGLEMDAQDLVGKKVIGQVIKKKNTKGIMTNRIVRFITLKDDPSDHYDKQDKIANDVAPDVEKENIPVVNDDEDDIDTKNIPF